MAGMEFGGEHAGTVSADRWRLASRFAALALGAAVLAGWAGVASPTLSQQEIAGLKLTSIAVTVAPEARIQWDDGLKQYAASKGVAYPQLGQGDSPEAKAYLASAVGAKLKGALQNIVGGTLNGSRPVRLDVIVRGFDISSPLQRVVIGGAYTMVADVNVVDAKTGAVILAYPNLSAYLHAGNGPVGAAVQAAVDASGPLRPALGGVGQRPTLMHRLPRGSAL